MKKKLIIFLSYLIIAFNTFVSAEEKKDSDILKIGALLPLSGELKNLGEEMLYSINLALHDIGDQNIKIYPKNSGSKKEMIIKSCEEFRKEGINIIIGPTDSEYFDIIENFQDLTFISLSNMNTENKKNIIMMGINLESQLLTIKDFIKKQNKKKTVILYPKNQYESHIVKNIKLANFENVKIFKYDSDPEILTKQIEKLTNYNQRKINLNSRVKKLEKSEDPKDIRELKRLEQKYTLGKVNFDSVVIIDFGDGLKSVLTSLAYTDVSEEDVLIITGNQWFDNSILQETSIKKFFFFFINFENFEKFNAKFFKINKYKPSEITILAYDTVGLIYYVWKKEKKIFSANNLNLKKSIKGKIGKFSIKNNKVIQDLKIYKIENGKFVKSTS